MWAAVLLALPPAHLLSPFRHSSNNVAPGASFAIAGDRVYVTKQTRLAAVELSTGKPIWSIPSPGGIATEPPVIQGQYLFVAGGGAFETMYALETSTGHVAWSKKNRASVIVAADGIVYANSQEPEGVVAIEASTGRTIWESIGDVPFRYVTAMAVNQQVLLTDDRALATRTGKLLWKWPDGVHPEQFVFGEGQAIVGGRDGFLAAIDPQDGKIRWQSNAFLREGVVGLALTGKHLFAVSYDDAPESASDGVLVSLEAETGKTLWNLQLHSCCQALPANPLSAANGQVFVVRPLNEKTGSEVIALDQATGAIMWAYRTSKGVLSGPAVPAGRLLLVSEGDGLIALERVTGKLVWRYR
jgi:outer membrane protein assembly factor BamB